MTSPRLAIVKQLLDAFGRSGADELTATEGGFRVRLRRDHVPTPETTAHDAKTPDKAAPEIRA